MPIKHGFRTLGLAGLTMVLSTQTFAVGTPIVRVVTELVGQGQNTKAVTELVKRGILESPDIAGKLSGDVLAMIRNSSSTESLLNILYKNAAKVRIETKALNAFRGQLFAKFQQTSTFKSNCKTANNLNDRCGLQVGIRYAGRTYIPSKYQGVHLTHPATAGKFNLHYDFVAMNGKPVTFKSADLFTVADTYIYLKKYASGRSVRTKKTYLFKTAREAKAQFDVLYSECKQCALTLAQTLESVTAMNASKIMQAHIQNLVVQTYVAAYKKLGAEYAMRVVNKGCSQLNKDASKGLKALIEGVALHTHVDASGKFVTKYPKGTPLTYLGESGITLTPAGDDFVKALYDDNGKLGPVAFMNSYLHHVWKETEIDAGLNAAIKSAQKNGGDVAQVLTNARKGAAENLEALSRSEGSAACNVINPGLAVRATI